MVIIPPTPLLLPELSESTKKFYIAFQDDNTDTLEPDGWLTRS